MRWSRAAAFAVQLPTVPQAALTVGIGTDSAVTEPRKLVKHGVQLFDAPGFDVPLVAGCAAWLVCKLIHEPHNQQSYDLFIAEVVGAWADERVFRNGHWEFGSAPPSCAPCTMWPGAVLCDRRIGAGEVETFMAAALMHQALAAIKIMGTLP